MAFPLKLRVGGRSLRWSGGGLLVLASLGLHGLLLGLPLAESDPAAQDLPPDPVAPVEVIDVVRLPGALATALPQTPAATPLPQATAPQAPRPQAVAPAAPARLAQAATASTAPTPAAPAAVAPPETLEPLPAQPPPQTLDDRLLDPAAYAFNQQAKSLIANEVAFHIEVVPNWIEAAGQGITDDNRLPIMGEKLSPLVVAYPLNACLAPPPAEGVVGVIVDAAGQRLEAPVLLDSTGYSVLDDKAMALALERAFPSQPAGSPLPNPRGYWMPVQVQYNAAGCNP